MKHFTLSVLTLAITGCASNGLPSPHFDLQASENTPLTQRLQAGAGLLEQGHTAAAREVFAEATAQDVTDPKRQTLLGLAYHAENKGGMDGVRMARVGYETALRSAPYDFWAGALAGRAAFDLGDFKGASDHFANLVLHHPHRAEPLAALAVAAYYAGDLNLALLTAQRAETVAREAPPESAADGPSPNGATPSPHGATLPSAALTLATALRVAALAHAARGDAPQMQGSLQRLALADPKGAAMLQVRSIQLLRTAPVDEEEGEDGGDAAEAPSARPRSAPGEKRQVTVDVAILLAQYKRSDRVGLNLLDGLRLQFSAGRESKSTRTNVANEFVRTITRAISLPDLTYNLNIFNRQGDYYEVAARPTLSALLGEPSEFFVGRSLMVEVSGVNTGTLKDIDVGIRLKALPLEIDESGAKIQITAERSFLQDGNVGTFQQALSTFRQSVSATARVEFGQTLLLSGLSETVSNSTGSMTPGLGEVPVLGLAFNQRTTDQRRDAVLILVTPSRTTSLPSSPWARSEHVQQLIGLWEKVVDPSTNAGNVAQRLSRMRLFSRMQSGDIPMAWPAPQQQSGQFAQAILRPEQP